MAWGSPCVPLDNSLPTKGSRNTPGCHLPKLCFSARPILGSEHRRVNRKVDFKEACVGTGDCRQGRRAGGYCEFSLPVPEAGVHRLAELASCT